MKLVGLPARPGREAVANVQTFLDEDRGRRIMPTAVVIASAAHNPELLIPIRKGCARTLSEITKEWLRFERAAVIISLRKTPGFAGGLTEFDGSGNRSSTLA